MNIFSGFATMKDYKKFLSVFGGHLRSIKIPSKPEEGVLFLLFNGRDLKAISRHK
jgi:hypothetical protein